MIEAKHLFFSYSQERKLLSNISFTLQPGEFAALLGMNGSGKSTLLKILIGQLTPTKGTCTIDNKPLTLKNLSHLIGYVPQKITVDQHHPATVKELLTDTRLCNHLDVSHLMKKQFNSLSGGQQQRVLVALALQHDPKYLLLDEPTVGVDETTRKNFYKLLAHLAKKHDKAILLVTHDNDLIEDYATRILCMDSHHKGECIHD